MAYTGREELEVMQYAHNYNKYLTSLVLSNVKSDDKIMDIGAGIGLFARLIAEYGRKVDCYEPDAEQAAMLRSMGLTAYSSLDDAPDGAYDFLYALNVLEHIENQQEALREWSKKLKHGGKMLIYVPAFNALFSAMDKKVGHYRRYTRRTLAHTAQAAGLTIIATAKYADSIGFFVTLLYKLTGSKSGAINRNALIIYDRLLFTSCPPHHRNFLPLVHLASTMLLLVLSVPAR